MRRNCRFAAAAALAILAGCSGNAWTGSSSSVQPDVIGGRASSWISPDAKRSDLLYISASESVYVYSYPGYKSVGMLTGFSGIVNGECNDSAGNVFILERPSDILKYAHGGSSPILTLHDTVAEPIACSVDPKTGDLGVLGRTSTGLGNVSIYVGAHGTPRSYPTSPGGVYQPYYCAYDDRGDFFIDGYYQKPESGASTQVFAIAELPVNGNVLKSLPLYYAKTGAGPILVPGGMQWDGQYLVVGNVNTNPIYNTDTVYRIAVEQKTGVVANFTRFSPPQGASNTPAIEQFLIVGKRLLGPGQGFIGIWNYPAGGKALNMLSISNTLTNVVLSAGK